MLYRREVDDFGKSVADLVQPVVEPEQADFLVADLRSDAPPAAECLAELDAEWPCLS